jgi:hypothetical protein
LIDSLDMSTQQVLTCRSISNLTHICFADGVQQPRALVDNVVTLDPHQVLPVLQLGEADETVYYVLANLAAEVSKEP